MDRSIDDGCIRTQRSMGDYLKKAAFISVILGLVSVGGVGAATPVNGCGTLSNAGETYVLSRDVSASGTCITIGADNITLDGAGYSITGDGSGDGVDLRWRSGVTVKNLSVSGFWSGIELYSSSYNTISNNTASNNRNGIYLGSSSNNTLTNNTAFDDLYGIYLTSSSYNTLRGNEMSNNTRNFYVSGSSLSHYAHLIDASNSVNGKPVYYNVSVSNYTIDSATNAGFVGVINSTNVTVRDLKFTKNGAGVLFAFTSNSKIQNVNASTNSVGIYLDSSSNNTLTNNNASNNGNGIYLTYSSNNTISGNNASNNYDGIYLDSSRGNTLTNNTASSNNDYGLTLFSSSGNTLTDNTASLNRARGIYVYLSGSNTIYNNFFNNSANYIDDASYNDWNTTKTPGTNIIGGPYIGGNFWAKPDGYGYSDTCTNADGDGICDSGYTLALGNVDHLPLTFTVPGTTFNITHNLNPGWNLISIPLEQDNWSITSVLAPIDGNYSVVFAYIDGFWKKSTAARNPLTEMTSGYGYWIYMSAPDTLELVSTVPPTTRINVSTGWNLVGYPSLNTGDITIVLSSINYSVVFAYIDEVWKKSTSSTRYPLTEMVPRYGYWMYANEAGSYAVVN